MRRTYFFYALLLLTTFIFHSCSVKKRKYQKGYFVEWKSNSLRKNKEQKLATNNKQSNEGMPEKSYFMATQFSQSASTDNSFITNDKHLQTIASPSPDDSCDVLVYKDGTESSVRLLEISSAQLKYKKCDMPEGPVYISYKSELFMIIYSIGTREVMATEPAAALAKAPIRVDDGTQPKSPTWLATNALVFSLVGLYPLFFPASIAGLIMAIIQIKRIEAEPNKYSGLRKSRAAIVLSIIGLYLSFLAYFLIIMGTL